MGLPGFEPGSQGPKPRSLNQASRQLYAPEKESHTVSAPYFYPNMFFINLLVGLNYI